MRHNVNKKLKKTPNKRKLSYTITDFYASYISYRKTWSTALDKKTFIAAVKLFFKLLAIAIIKDNYIYRFPKRLGEIRIRKTATTKRKSINWDVYNTTGVYSKHLNTHSEKSHFKWFWFKKFPLAFFTNQTYYSFKPVDDKANRIVGRRGLSSWIQHCANTPTIKDYDALP